MEGNTNRFSAVDRMKSISLEEMDAIRLMNRIDTKFVTNEEVLKNILEDAKNEGYRVCEINGQRIMSYESLYYDTDDCQMFICHRNKKKTRQKVRTRTYDVTGISFLEIKTKNNKGRTKKVRMKIPTENFSHIKDNSEAMAFLSEKCWIDPNNLSPACTTNFNRITLVNPAKTERLTIDLDLKFNSYRTNQSAKLDEAVIIELKQDGRVHSPMREILRQHRVKPYHISKYCIGITLTDFGIRSNRFKIKIRYIEKLIKHKITSRYD